jgi:hypothetical protein
MMSQLVNFIHCYDNLEECEKYIHSLNLQAIILCLNGGNKTLYTFCLQKTIDIMQDELTQVRANYVERELKQND